MEYDTEDGNSFKRIKHIEWTIDTDLLRCVILYSAIFCYILLYSAIFCYILLYSAVFYYILLYSAAFRYIQAPIFERSLHWSILAELSIRYITEYSSGNWCPQWREHLNPYFTLYFLSVREERYAMRSGTVHSLQIEDIRGSTDRNAPVTADLQIQW